MPEDTPCEMTENFTVGERAIDGGPHGA